MGQHPSITDMRTIHRKTASMTVSQQGEGLSQEQEVRHRWSWLWAARYEVWAITKPLAGRLVRAKNLGRSLGRCVSEVSF
jgi:hypothetical protein